MSDEKFTPGPWKIIDMGYGYCIEPNVAWLGDNSKRTKKMRTADARLIASAPDLYKMLNDCHSVIFDLLASIMEDEVVPDTIIAEAQEQLDEIRDMLKKARGEK